MLVAPSQTTPEWKEQFGRMIVEAFATGVPVVGSDSGEIPYVIDDVGLIVPEADVDAWAKAINGLLHSPARRRELGEQGYERFQSPRYTSSRGGRAVHRILSAGSWIHPLAGSSTRRGPAAYGGDRAAGRGRLPLRPAAPDRTVILRYS